MQRLKITSLLLQFRCMTSYMKACSFLNAHCMETTKVDEHLFKKAYDENTFTEKNICCRYTLELPHTEAIAMYTINICY